MVISRLNGFHKLAIDSWIADVSNSYFNLQHFLLAAIRVHWIALAYTGDSLRVQGITKQKTN